MTRLVMNASLHRCILRTIDRALIISSSNSFLQGPFVTFDIPLARSPLVTPSSNSFFTWSSLKFSPDGKDLLITTTEHDGAVEKVTNRILLIDSYEGEQKQLFTGHEYQPTNSNTTVSSSSSSSASHTSASSYLHLPFEASFSPDGSFIFAGSRSGSIHSWDVTSGEPVAIWSASKVPITAIQFCPTRMTLVTGDATGQVHWWIPQTNANTNGTANSTYSH